MQTRKIMSLITGMVMLILLVPHNIICLAAEVEMAVLTTGKYDFDGDSTTMDAVYEIENGKQLLWFSRLVGGELTGVTQNKSANAILVSDIDLSAVCGEKIGSWEPIGTDYSGIFDGNQKTIRNLYFNVDNKYFADESKMRAGIFSTADGAVIKNITLEDSYINASRFVGGIVGEAEDSKILNCCNKAEIVATYYAGGIVGNGSAVNCSNYGAVTAVNSVGGIVGYGAASECYNMGDISGNDKIGGIVGYAVGDIINCFNRGGISSTSNVGGIIGYSIAPIKIENCYNASIVSFEGNTGYIAGYAGVGATGMPSFINCYFEDASLNASGVGYAENGIVSNTYACLTADFNSGKICWLLNGSSYDGVWKQTLDKDMYPCFEGKTVYCNNSQYYNETRLNLTKSALTVKDLSGSASLIVASYKDKAFVDAEVISVLENYENGLEDIGLKISGTDTVKAFLWEDMTKLIPLCKSQEITLE